MKKQKKQAGVLVFVSYAQTDLAIHEQLAIHLSQLKRNGLIEAWSDQQILAGSDRAQTINQAICSADIILLLISPDFLASDACYQIEMQQALERHQRGEASVVPLLVRPCDWQHSPFAHLQCLPHNTKPLTTWINQDEAFVSMIQELRKIITQQFQIDPEELLPFKAILPDQAGQTSQRFDWGEAPHLDQLYGRDQELTMLKQWIKDDSCRLVAILGMGGIGKTSLVATLVDQVQDHYDYIFWRSLHNAPPFKHLLQECIRFISHQQQVVLPEEADSQISLLIEYFRTCHCLLVLDNIESILQEGGQAGHYRVGCEGYGKLFQRIGESKHQSCLLVMSREKPPEVALLEGEDVATRSLHLGGLKPADGREILIDKGLQGTEQNWEVLINHYGGNPLALKLVAQMIREVFAGSITAFLTDGDLLFRDVRDVLEQQMKRLSAQEEEIVYWLAIEREAIALSDLRENIVHALLKGELQEALRSLRRRQLIETTVAGFILQPVIMEYLTDRLVDQVCEEIRTERLLLFKSHALLKAQTKDYIRESQQRLILLPLLQQCFTIFSNEALEQQFQSLLATLHTQHDHRPSYVAGNVLNLLIQMGCPLRGYDFSHLVVWQAYLQGVALPEVNFAHSDLAKSVFTDTFGSILCVALSPQSELLAAATATGEIRVWHATSGLPLKILRGHPDWIWSLTFSSDGRFLASGCEDQTVRLWEVSSGKLLNTLHGHTNIVSSLAFGPDGKTLASGSDDQTVRLWEVSSGQCLNILHGHDHWVSSVAFSPDGKTLASGSDDQTVRLWEVSGGQCLNTLHGHTSMVETVAFSPDGKTLASGGDDQTVRLWEVSGGQCLNTLHGHSHRVWSVAFSPDGRTLASGSDDQTIRLWEASSGQCFKTLYGHTNTVSSVAFSSAGNILASGSHDKTVRIWEARSGKLLNTLHGHANPVRSVAFSPDGKTLASGNEDQTIRLWEVSSGQCLKTLHNHANVVKPVAFSPDGKTLASASNDQTVRLWEVSSGQCLKTLHGHSHWVSSLAFSPDGRTLASGSEDQTICLWEVSSGQCLNILHGHDHWVSSLAFSPDGKILISGSGDHRVCLWEMSSRKLLNSLHGHADAVRSVAFSPDGKTLASGSSDQTIRLWEVRSGQCLKTLHGHTSAVSSVAFSPDGRTLVSGSYDQTVRLWEVSSGQCLNTLHGHSHWVSSVAFSPDGKIFVSSSYGGEMNLWDGQTCTCLRILRNDKPYERMNITQVKGLTEAQKATLRLLGAIENE